MEVSAWSQEYVRSSLSRWGHGVCWKYMESGECSNVRCRMAHPQLVIADGDLQNTNTTVVSSERMELWTEALTAAGFIKSAVGDGCEGGEVALSGGENEGNPEDFTPCFGEHRGKKLFDIPTSYVHWCLEKDSDYAPMAELIMTYNQYRKKTPYVCAFGKYRGKTMDKVERKYIDWAKRQFQPSKEMKELIAEWSLFHAKRASEPNGAAGAAHDRLKASNSMVHPELDPCSAFQALFSHGVRAEHMKAVGNNTLIQRILEYQERGDDASAGDSEHQEEDAHQPLANGDENQAGEDEESEEAEEESSQELESQLREELAAYLEELRACSPSKVEQHLLEVRRMRGELASSQSSTTAARSKKDRRVVPVKEEEVGVKKRRVEARSAFSA